MNKFQHRAPSLFHEEFRELILSWLKQEAQQNISLNTKVGEENTKAVVPHTNPGKIVKGTKRKITVNMQQLSAPPIQHAEA